MRYLTPRRCPCKADSQATFSLFRIGRFVVVLTKDPLRPRPYERSFIYDLRSASRGNSRLI